MIDSAVQQLADTFRRDWTMAAEFAPVLDLDATWPSLGVADLLTYPMRGAIDLDEAESEVLQGIAAHLALLVHECWESFGVSVDVRVGPNGVEIVGVDGPHLGDGEQVVLEIEAALRKLVAECPEQFPLLRQYVRPIPADYNYLSLFGIGVMTGRSPFLTGPWERVALEDFEEPLQHVQRVLARGCAERYARLFPDEPLGQVAELYLNRLIFPPTMMDEAIPAIGACEGIARFVEEYGVKGNAVRPLLENLTQSPDELISNTAIAFLAAVSDVEPSPVVRAACLQKGDFAGFLRGAMMAVRKHYQLGEDWLAKDSLDDNDVRRFEIEQQFGFLPWVALPSQSLKNPAVLPVVRALSIFDLAAATHEAEKAVEENPKDLQLRMQRVFLDLRAGDVERGEHGFKALVTEPGAEEEPYLFNHWAICELALGNHESALRHLGIAHELASRGDYQGGTLRKAEIANNYALVLMQNEEFEKALFISATAVQCDPCPVTAKLNQSYALRSLSREDEALAIDRELLKLAPLDNRVYGNLVAWTLNNPR